MTATIAKTKEARPLTDLSMDRIDQISLEQARRDLSIANQRIVELTLAIAALEDEILRLRKS